MRGELPNLATRIAGYLPLSPMELALRHLINRALSVRPGFTARLAEYAGRTFAIAPVDCPFAFLITAREGKADVEIVRDLDGHAWDARIKAPLVVLIGMIEGRYDGDAVFFSRDLMIEGDTEAVLALRNALEDAEFDPASVFGLPAPVRGPFNRAAEMAFAETCKLLDAPESSDTVYGGHPA